MFYLQFMAANSFKYSALYTRPTVRRGHTWKEIYNKYRSKDIIIILPRITTSHNISKQYWTVLLPLA